MCLKDLGRTWSKPQFLVLQILHGPSPLPGLPFCFPAPLISVLPLLLLLCSPHACSASSFPSLFPSFLLWPTFFFLCPCSCILQPSHFHSESNLDCKYSFHISKESSGNQHLPGSIVSVMISWEVGHRGRTTSALPPCTTSRSTGPPCRSSCTQVPVFMTF